MSIKRQTVVATHPVCSWSWPRAGTWSGRRPEECLHHLPPAGLHVSYNTHIQTQLPRVNAWWLQASYTWVLEVTSAFTSVNLLSSESEMLVFFHRSTSAWSTVFWQTQRLGGNLIISKSTSQRLPGRTGPKSLGNRINLIPSDLHNNEKLGVWHSGRKRIKYNCLEYVFIATFSCSWAFYLMNTLLLFMFFVTCNQRESLILVLCIYYYCI